MSQPVVRNPTQERQWIIFLAAGLFGASVVFCPHRVEEEKVRERVWIGGSQVSIMEKVSHTEYSFIWDHHSIRRSIFFAFS